MVRFILQHAARSALAVALFVVGVGASPPAPAKEAPSLGVDVAELLPVVDNPYVALSSMKGAVYTGKDRDPDTGKTSKVRTELTVRDTAVMVAGVKVTVVDVTDHQDGEAVEKSRDYYAQHSSGAVYYIGEEVDDLSDGKIVGHEGQWMAGKGGCKAGVLMSAAPKVGDAFDSARAPGIAQERSKVLAAGRTVKVAAGTFSNCIEIEVYDLIEKSTTRKVFCSGVGLVKESGPDRTIELASHEKR